MMSLRRVVAAGMALGVTFGLLYLMQALISQSDLELDERARGAIVEFVRLKKDSELELKKREMPEKELPPKPPPMPDLSLTPSHLPGQELGLGVGIDVDLELAAGPNLGAAASDAEPIPVVRVDPQYPIRAAERGIEGWVEVEFTISATGTVKKPVVISSYPGGIFNGAALRAIRRWKYNPKIENGKPVERAGLRVRLKFELEE